MKSMPIFEAVILDYGQHHVVVVFLRQMKRSDHILNTKESRSDAANTSVNHSNPALKHIPRFMVRLTLNGP